MVTGVIAQMFEWSYDSIAQECTDYLGPAGFKFVQASPAQEEIQGGTWWTAYQPVSYNINSKRGDRQSFGNMVSTCKDAGVGIIADTIFNHMSSGSGTGFGGTEYQKYQYPVYSTNDFHHCTLTSSGDIESYYNQAQVQTCELDGLSDLATDTEYVRSQLAGYANDLLSLGVSGLRLDAAKHIPTADIASILSRLDRMVYITQEVIFGEGEPVTPSMYTQNGDVQEFRYTYAIKDAFQNSGIQTLKDIDSRGWVDSSGANVFVSNHDTERNGLSLNYNDGALYTLAMTFSLAHPYGLPTILSSYEFDNKDAGAPNGNTGTCNDTGGENGWICQHRWVQVAGMVGFRNNAGSASLSNWETGLAQQIAFARDGAGWVGINNESGDWTKEFTTSLPDNTYCDVYNGGMYGCDNKVTVSNGKATVTIPGKTAVAIHTGRTA
ncbi:glycoside hydrolase family 13 protein [Atractiella rhizophila]|nr:glycoside hydrolase family 13 protein [Atractiella rhizophila]